MNETSHFRRFGMASLPLIAAALLIAWAYWSSLTGAALP